MGYPRNLFPMILLGLAFGLSLYGWLEFDAIRFVAEDIQINLLGSDRVRFSARYHYRNVLPWAIDRVLRFPLLVTPDHPRPEEITVRENGRWLLPETDGGTNFFFPLRFAGGATLTLDVTMVQPTPAQVFRYPVTTTRTWGRPIGTARFRLNAGESGQIWTSCSLASGALASEPTLDLLFRDFWPATELTVTWAGKPCLATGTVSTDALHESWGNGAPPDP